ncbi:CoxG family protein [Spongiivirga citrea]|uniref:Carbon monoxide dehydrogenase n=1 Tax=Spongiivirga citrea TaxID=1481457 RepID=A0A6M0CDB4_9FLAO|nr:SRPBCC domain-containing protein [Spongiivirga citrea]NER15818.1 carbon monoxide dehydrogenase [Spongiivirga citrea]
MQVKGNYMVNTTPNVVWDMITNPAVLEKITPGIKTLTVTGPDQYDAISEVKVGPVKGNFEGTLSLKDQVNLESCVLVVDQKSKMGNVVAEISMKLIPDGNDNTEVQYTGDAKMSGMLARMGQRIMSGVVSTLSRQFFQSLNKELEGEPSTE